jgi:hypothetical protein
MEVEEETLVEIPRSSWGPAVKNAAKHRPVFLHDTKARSSGFDINEEAAGAPFVRRKRRITSRAEERKLNLREVLLAHGAMSSYGTAPPISLYQGMWWSECTPESPELLNCGPGFMQDSSSWQSSDLQKKLHRIMIESGGVKEILESAWRVTKTMGRCRNPEIVSTGEFAMLHSRACQAFTGNRCSAGEQRAAKEEWKRIIKSEKREKESKGPPGQVGKIKIKGIAKAAFFQTWLRMVDRYIGNVYFRCGMGEYLLAQKAALNKIEIQLELEKAPKPELIQSPVSKGRIRMAAESSTAETQAWVQIDPVEAVSAKMVAVRIAKRAARAAVRFANAAAKHQQDAWGCAIAADAVVIARQAAVAAAYCAAAAGRSTVQARLRRRQYEKSTYKTSLNSSSANRTRFQSFQARRKLEALRQAQSLDTLQESLQQLLRARHKGAIPNGRAIPCGSPISVLRCVGSNQA